MRGDPAYPPLENNAHFNSLFVSKTNTLEGELDLDDISLIIDSARAVEDKVLAEIFTTARVTAVGLDTQRIDVEGVEGLLVVKGVQVDTNPVIGADCVAPRDRSLDLIGLAIETFKAEI